LTCLFAYPCIDFVVTLIRRYKAGRSIFCWTMIIYTIVFTIIFSGGYHQKTLANSMTGVLVVASSSTVASAGYLDQ
jgi:uncharacterized membrane protein